MSGKSAKLVFPARELRQRLIGENGDEKTAATTPAADEGVSGGDDEELEDVPLESGGGDDAGRGVSPDGKIAPATLRTLKNYHIAAAVIIGVAWLTTLIVLLIYRFCTMPTSLIGDTSSAFRRWGGVDPLFLGRFIYDPTLFARGFNILIPAVLFGLVPTLIHLILAVSSSTRSPGSDSEPLFLWHAKYALNNRVNPLRWIQYALSYTLVAWIVLQFSGVTDVVTLGLLVGAKLAIYGSMWIFEVQNQRREVVHWEVFGLSTFLFILFWIAAFIYFAIEMISAPLITDTPWYFWVFVLGSALSCILGGLIVIIHFMSAYRQSNNANYEHWFIIHEIISLVFFSVVLIVATIMAPPLP